MANQNPKFFAMMDGDQIPWVLENQTEAINKFKQEGKSWSILVGFSTKPSKLYYDCITHEYDIVSNEFIPYRPYYYAVLNPNKTINIMTFYKPTGTLRKDYVCVLRHMGEYFYRRGLPITNEALAEL